MTFTSKTRLLAPGSAREAIAVSPRAPVVAAAGGGKLQVHNFVTKQTATVAVSARGTALAVSEDGRFVAYEAGAGSAVIDPDKQGSLPPDPAGPRQARFYYD